MPCFSVILQPGRARQRLAEGEDAPRLRLAPSSPARPPGGPAGGAGGRTAPPSGKTRGRNVQKRGEREGRSTNVYCLAQFSVSSAARAGAARPGLRPARERAGAGKRTGLGQLRLGFIYSPSKLFLRSLSSGFFRHPPLFASPSLS